MFHEITHLTFLSLCLRNYHHHDIPTNAPTTDYSLAFGFAMNSSESLRLLLLAGTMLPMRKNWIMPFRRSLSSFSSQLRVICPPAVNLKFLKALSLTTKVSILSPWSCLVAGYLYVQEPSVVDALWVFSFHALVLLSQQIRCSSLGCAAPLNVFFSECHSQMTVLSVHFFLSSICLVAIDLALFVSGIRPPIQIYLFILEERTYWS